MNRPTPTPTVNRGHTAKKEHGTRTVCACSWEGVASKSTSDMCDCALYRYQFRKDNSFRRVIEDWLARMILQLLIWLASTVRLTFLFLCLNVASLSLKFKVHLHLCHCNERFRHCSTSHLIVSICVTLSVPLASSGQCIPGATYVNLFTCFVSLDSSRGTYCLACSANSLYHVTLSLNSLFCA